MKCLGIGLGVLGVFDWRIGVLAASNGLLFVMKGCRHELLWSLLLEFSFEESLDGWTGVMGMLRLDWDRVL